jgi:hypothetical protein
VFDQQIVEIGCTVRPKTMYFTCHIIKDNGSLALCKCRGAFCALNLKIHVMMMMKKVAGPQQ